MANRIRFSQWLLDNRKPLVVVGGVFFLALLLSQWLQDRLARHLIEKVVDAQRMRVDVSIVRFEKTLLRAELSIANFAEVISQYDEILPGEFTPLTDLLRRDPDGSWRTPRATYQASKEAGLWIPPSVKLTDAHQRFFVSAQKLTSIFGLAAVDELVGNTWVLPLTNGEVIFWPDDPNFIYNSSSDLDYRKTPWVQLTSPANNPAGKPIWIEPSYDPAAHSWLISVVAPFQIMGRWAGSVGHDIRVEDLLRSIVQDDVSPMALREGSSGAKAPLFVARADGQLLLQRGAVPAQGQHLPKALMPFLLKGMDTSGTETFQDRDDFIIVAPMRKLNAQMLYVVQGKWIRNSLHNELQGLQFAEGLILSTLMGSAAVLVIRDAQNRIRQQELLERRNKDLEVLVGERTKALELASERLQQEVLQASHIQKELLASERDLHTQAPDLEIGVLMVPSKEVGGDLYDCIPLPGKRYLICIGDVAGKGMPAALLMSTCLSLLRSYSEVIDSPAAIVRRVNQRLCIKNDECAFTTLFLGTLNARNGELRYCNAGHNPILLQRKDQMLEDLNHLHGPALGIVDGHTYGESIIFLGKDDFLLAYTDGVIDTFSKSQERYGQDRLKRAVLVSNHLHSSKVVRSVMRSLREFSLGEYQHDDITLLGIRRREIRAKMDSTPPRASQGQRSSSMNKQEERALLISVRNEMDALEDAKEQVEQFSENYQLSRSTRRQLMVVVDELLNNSIRHGCKDLGTMAVISLRLNLTEDAVQLEFRDNGDPPFNPLESSSPDLSGSLDEREIGGLGIHLVKTIAKELNYHVDSGFNVISVKLAV